MSLARDIAERLFFPNKDPHAIPVLDGGFSPNQRLEHAQVLAGFDAPDALALAADGRLFVSSKNAVYACSGQRFTPRAPFAHVEASAGALACTSDGRLLVAVAGHGLRAFDQNGNAVGAVASVDGRPLACATAIATAADGTIYVTDGSRHNGPEQWLLDLMEDRGPSGRLIACAPDLSNARVIREGLSWPAGVVVSHDEGHVLVTESWPHRLTSYPRSGGSGPRTLVGNFAGYPGRIGRGTRQDYWVVFFALRTQLTEFVLRETPFRQRMMQEIPANLWIGPSLGGTLDVREATQIGRIKKLGIQKPWAPARSYGLAARIDETGRAIESLHSRVSGQLHGITAALEHRGELLVVSKGHGKLAAANLVRPSIEVRR